MDDRIYRGTRPPGHYADLVARRTAGNDVAVGNGALPTGEQPVPKAFKRWKTFALYSPWFPIGRIVQTGTIRKMSRAEIAAYDAPFPSARYKAGARMFPKLVPVTPDDPARDANIAAWAVFRKWTKPEKLRGADI